MKNLRLASACGLPARGTPSKLVRGRARPELGGSPAHRDIAGLNYYWTNQWVLGREGTPLADDDPRRVPRIHELSTMAEQLLAEGVPLGGICLYPILGMPEWHARDQWARMGLWDLEREQNALKRKACDPMMAALRVVHEARGPDVGRKERLLRLPRTGNVPFESPGRLVWQRVRPNAHAIRLFRSDRPYRLWIVAITLRFGERTLDHVWTAGELASVLQTATTRGPVQLAREHGTDDAEFVAEDIDAWRTDLLELASQAQSFHPRRHVPYP